MFDTVAIKCEHFHENYCANTGNGCGKENSDAFYHWGGLLGLISVLENEFNRE